jgi:hypothetical protein
VRVSDGSTQPDRRKRIVLISSAAAALVVLVVLVIVLQHNGDGSDSSKTPTGSATSGPPRKSSPPPSSLPASKRAVPSASPPVKVPKATPARFRDNVVLANKVGIEVADIESVQGKARGPGEVAGPALRFTVRVTNNSKKAINLDLAVVTAYFGRKDDPASQLSGPGAAPLPQKLKSGATASGKYVFAVPPAQRSRVRVDFSYIINQPTIIFRGPGR